MIVPIDYLVNHLKKWFSTYLIVVGASLMTLYPAVLNPITHVQTMPGSDIAPDTYNYLYALQRFAINLSNFQNPLHDPFQNYPDGLDLIYLDIPVVSFFVAAPFAILVSPIFAYHLVIFISSLGSGFAVAWWMSIIDIRTRWVINTTAVLAVLLPFRVIHGIDHPNVASTYTLIIWFVVVDWWLHCDGDKPRYFYILAGISALLALNSIQHVFIVVILGGVFIVSRIIFLHEWSKIVSHWHRWLVGVLSIGIGLFLGLIPFISAQDVVFSKFTPDQVEKFSAIFWSYVLPAPYTFWAYFFSIDSVKYIVSNEQYISPGILVYLLAMVAILRLPRKISMPFVLLCVTGVLLSFGSYIQAKGTFLNNFPMPAQLLQSLGFDAFRAWARFGGIVGIFMVLLAGLGLEKIVKSFRRGYQTYGAMIVVGCAVLLGNMPVALESKPVPDNPMATLIAQMPESTVVGFVFYTRYKSIADQIYPVRYLLIQKYTYRTMVFYAHSAHQPKAFQYFEQDLQYIDQPFGGLVLCRRGITHIFIDNTSLKLNPNITDSLYLKEIQTLEHWHLFELVGC